MGDIVPLVILPIFLGAFPIVMLALLGWQLGHGTALQPWPSTLASIINYQLS